MDREHEESPKSYFCRLAKKLTILVHLLNHAAIFVMLANL